MKRVSSWLLLLGMFHLRLIVFCLLNGMVAVLAGVAIENGAFAANLAAVLALLLTVGLRLDRILAGTLFPILDRQAAWLPMVATGLIWAAGLAGLLAGQALQAAGNIRMLTQAVEGWIAFAQTLPGTLFMLMVVLRLKRSGNELMAIPMVFCIGMLLDGGEHSRTLLIHYWWAFLGGAIFLFLEAPAHWSMLRLQGRIKNREALGGTSWDGGAPTRYTAPTLVAQGLIGALAAPFLGFLALMFFEWVCERLTGNKPFKIEDWILPALLAYGGVNWIRTLYYQHWASGFRPLAAGLLVLARLTIVLNPLATFLGVRRGQIIRCPRCGEWRFIWQERCPHCEGSIQLCGEVMRLRPVRRWNWPPSDPIGHIYWFLAPLLILLLILDK